MFENVSLRTKRRLRRGVKASAETIREIGILLLVFGLLDEHTRRSNKIEDLIARGLCGEIPVNVGWVLFALGLGVFLILCGIVFDAMVS